MYVWRVLFSSSLRRKEDSDAEFAELQQYLRCQGFTLRCVFRPFAIGASDQAPLLRLGSPGVGTHLL